jgi:hypothetical protein
MGDDEKRSGTDRRATKEDGPERTHARKKKSE